jgi:chromosome segregation ATPase
MEKQTYLRRIAKKLEEWDDKIAELRARANEQEGGAETEWKRQFNQLETKRKAFAEKLKVLQSAGEEAWDDLRKGADAAWEDIEAGWKDIESALDKARVRLRGAAATAGTEKKSLR